MLLRASQKVNITITFLCETLWVTLWFNCLFFTTELHGVKTQRTTEFLDCLIFLPLKRYALGSY